MSNDTLSVMVKRSTPQAISYIRAIGFAAICFGVAAMIIAEYFWSATLLIYLGLFVLLVDALTDKVVAAWIRLAMGIVCVSGLVLFTWHIVLPAPSLSTHDPMIQNHANEDAPNLPGLAWNKTYSELDFPLLNTSDFDYTDMVVTLETDRNIADVGQISSHANVEIQPELHAIPIYSGNIEGALLAKNRTTSAPVWKIYCDKLRKGDTLEIDVATVNLKKAEWGPLIPLTKDVHPPTSPPPGGPRLDPTWLKIKADYKGRFGRPIHFEETLHPRRPF
ncbi:MAG: hypothetical protein ACRD72_18905 [Candidatus Angelobacter sp.]